MIEQKKIETTEVGRILALQEGHFLDFKAAAITPAKLSESVSAFGNTAGGELFVGISEGTDRKRHSWRGFATMEEANGFFQVLNGMTPLGFNYGATWMNCVSESGYVLQLVIPKTKDILLATDGHPYIRRNAQNLRVTGAEGLQRLRLDKGITSFEDDVVTGPARHRASTVVSPAATGATTDASGQVGAQDWRHRGRRAHQENENALG